MEEEEGNFDKDVLLLSKKIEIVHKQFCLDFKENSQNQYLILSNKASSILLPSSGISCFLDFLDSCIVSQKHECVNKELKINDKVFFYLIIGQNRWGRFLKVSEALASKNCKYIMIPSGNNGNDGWELFKKTLAEINQTARILFPPRQQIPVPSEHRVELADAKCDFNMGHGAQNASMSKLHVKPPQNENSSFDVSKTMKTGQKRFFFYLESNTRGHFLKISEEIGANRFFITIPLLELNQFYERVSHFLEITNSSSERLSTGMDVKQSSSTCISESHELSGVGHFLEITNSSSERLSTGMDVKQSSSTCISESHELSGVGHFLEITNSSSERLSTGMDVKQSSSTCISESHELSAVNQPCASGEVK